MCTVGVTVSKNRERMLLFKNLDEKIYLPYAEPRIEKGEQAKYLTFPFTTDPSKQGPWAGINEFGVTIFGLDANAVPDFHGPRYGTWDQMRGTYQWVLENARDAIEGATHFVRDFQRIQFGGPGDIVFLADRKTAVVVEYIVDHYGLRFLPLRDHYMAQSNFFQVMRHWSPDSRESTLHTSSLLRYQTALKILSTKNHANDLEDVKALLRNHDNGPSAMSICRHSGDGEYRTLNSVIFDVTAERADVHYVMNALPCTTDYRKLVLPLRGAR